MASNHELPEYPHDEALVRRHVSLSAMESPHSHSARYNARTKTLVEQSGVQAAAYYSQGVAEYNRFMASGDTLNIKLGAVWSGFRDDPRDHNSLSLWDEHGHISLHVAFNRYDRTIRINTWDGQWGNEIYTSFPDSIVQEVHTTIAIQYWAPGSYTIHIGGMGLDVDVPRLSAPNALTYRVSRNNDGMFGGKVDTTLNY
ncbi:predicted protein [Aspergillus nidulans FGSC A4]|uniref:Galectin n=1 Tax=Emericella nidulans (strain FGSC A4 / ATCC 38163 / CBS 112.46 / NRRL 194 / M139) TaxID=227321 RepID=Q5B884_EMENI|nr:hypothetical protein [Aspergillus nidulans FGSC A4]EAA63147.1 predicted protein [Aspergillus nidulans FGSC A4]CBF83107.1 TPA: conserved hypothetical protein [Aspergillus nidulans FGSC A4]|eukprot:XP_660850.1 predicted protein [Aspergillus nidulans FGSC A4]